ncbi:MAG: HD domain-containing protein, partial [Moraxellaceae bacterium]
ILRFEVKAARSRYLDFAGVRTLHDLLSLKSMQALGVKINQVFSKLVFNDYSIEPLKLSTADRTNYLLMKDPNEWAKHKKHRSSTHRNRESRFLQIVKRHGKNNIQADLQALIAEKVGMLTKEQTSSVCRSNYRRQRSSYYQFYEAKQSEQKRRYAQHNNTESNLEPDIKNAPGGLRDLNQIGWVAKRHFRVVRVYDLVHLGFISNLELRELEEAENFLWQVRYQLHRIAGRDENRLLFDYQRDVASRLGFIQRESDPNNHAVEQFMKTYYRVAMKVSTLNEMLLAYFYESVIEPRLAEEEHPESVVLNQRFNLIGNKIAVSHHRVFSHTPSAILELFHLMANQPEIIGIRAKTLRLLMLAAKSIDDNFRKNSVHRAMFMAILRAPYHLYHTLHAMKRYGVLGKYIPAFGHIIGLMQYDLFHIYTVDAHTLLLIRNLRRFGKPEFAAEFPVVNSVFQRLDRKEIVYLAAIFHDIAKGRGGDHSELGAEDAIEFCRNHGLT